MLILMIFEAVMDVRWRWCGRRGYGVWRVVVNGLGVFLFFQPGCFDWGSFFLGHKRALPVLCLLIMTTEENRS